ncbi:hypothetical protein ACFY6U_06470 [Streptomyces sp. NPDC013157]|uniref:hypothetical protein n=1 Tax=Streptomyces sp. NPDC013157 TaxID=3364861 RepID=UPI0036AB2698
MEDLSHWYPCSSDEALGMVMVSFDRSPQTYRHWRLSTDGPLAWLELDVDERGGLVPGYELKLNSYDLGVDIVLYDAVQRPRAAPVRRTCGASRSPRWSGTSATTASPTVTCAPSTTVRSAWSASPYAAPPGPGPAR